MHGWTVAGLALVLAGAMPGCLDPTAPPEATPEHLATVTEDPSPRVVLEQGPGLTASGEDAYWFVYVTGGEEEGIVMCDRGFSYDVNVTDRSLSFSPEAHPMIDPANLSGVVAYSVDRGSCPMAYGLDVGNGTTQWDLGVLGKATILLTPDGEALVTLEGKQSKVPVGMQLRITGEGQVRQYGETWDATGDVVVANHGAWPRSGLQGADDGPRW